MVASTSYTYQPKVHHEVSSSLICQKRKSKLTYNTMHVKQIEAPMHYTMTMVVRNSLQQLVHEALEHNNFFIRRGLGNKER